MKHEHKPVLLAETINGLAIKPDGIYIDGTFGRGGHAQAILQQLSSKGRLFAIDKDPEAVHAAKEKFKEDSRFYVIHGSFIELESLAKEFNIIGKVDGILLDLGVSSPQIDNEERGFSFLREGPLDMRMDTTKGISAAEWLKMAKTEEIIKVLREYGEERFAKRIANAIVNKRKEQEIETTKQLAELIDKAVPIREKHKHPATRSFQAIRIFVNNELNELQDCLKQSLEVLAIGGRLVVISFHSLEGRIVKRFIRDEEKGKNIPAKLPIRESEFKKRLKHIGRAIKPDLQEIKINIRARSAVLRIAEKIS